MSFCDELPPNAVNGYVLNPESVERTVVTVEFLPTQGDILIVSQPGLGNSDWPLHEVNLTYQRLDLETGDIVPASYPDADVVTHELTDKLGITDRVFGENSVYRALIVSPQRDRVLYFPDDKHVWSAHIDGTDPRELSGTNRLRYGFPRLQWDGDDRVYLTLSNDYGGNSQIWELCLDGSCASLLSVDGNSVWFDAVSLSPDRRWLAIFEGYGDEIILRDRETGVDWTTPKLEARSQFAPVWSADGKSFYYVHSYSGAVVEYSIEARPDHGTWVAPPSSVPSVYDWLFLPGYRMVVFPNGPDGILITCFAGFEPRPMVGEGIG